MPAILNGISLNASLGIVDPNVILNGVTVATIDGADRATLNGNSAAIVNGGTQDAGRFLLLDTVEEGKAWGSYCDRRVEWLQRSLDEASDMPVYLFMHHPPFHVGLFSVDRIGMGADGERVGEVVSKHDNIRHLFFGHVHRPISGSWHGIPYSTLRGINHQVPLDFAPLEVVPKSHEQPAYAVIFLEADQTTVHMHDYLDTYRVPYEKRTEGRPDWSSAE